MKQKVYSILNCWFNCEVKNFTYLNSPVTLRLTLARARATNFITILSNSFIQKIEITNSIGECIHNEHVHNYKEIKLNTTNFNSSFYFIKIILENNSVHYLKFLKQE